MYFSSECRTKINGMHDSLALNWLSLKLRLNEIIMQHETMKELVSIQNRRDVQLFTHGNQHACAFLQIILFSHWHSKISKKCLSVIKKQSMQVWRKKKKSIQIRRFIISPCWSMQKKSCPLTNMQMLKATHSMSCWVYRAEQSPSTGGYQDSADPCLLPLHSTGSHQTLIKSLSALSHPHQLHTDTDMGEYSVVLGSNLINTWQFG